MSGTSYLKHCNKIVLVPGHGGIDPGAVNGSFYERDQVAFITNRIASKLRAKGLKVDTLPDNINNNKSSGNWVLQAHIDWVNNNYPAFDENRNDNVWAIEIHRDCNCQVANPVTQMGIYYHEGDGGSLQIANELLKSYRASGASGSSWVLGHGPRGGRTYPLGWIQRTNPLAHLLEHGFMSGDNSQETMEMYAEWSAKAIYKAFTGQELQERPEPTDKDTFKPPHNQTNSTPEPMSKHEDAYIRLISNPVFNSEGIDQTDRQAVFELNYPYIFTMLASSRMENSKKEKMIKEMEKHLHDCQKANSSEKPWWESKKFAAIILGLILAVANRFGLNLSPEIVTLINTTIIAYVASQSVVDVTNIIQKS